MEDNVPFVTAILSQLVSPDGFMKRYESSLPISGVSNCVGTRTGHLHVVPKAPTHVPSIGPISEYTHALELYFREYLLPVSVPTTPRVLYLRQEPQRSYVIRQGKPYDESITGPRL